MAHQPNQPSSVEEAGYEGPAPEGGDIDQALLIKSYFAFAMRAVRKRTKGVIATFLVVALASVIALMLWPSSYRSESTMVFNRGGALDAGQNDTPFRGATDIVRRRESLQKIIKEANLTARYPAERSPLGKLKAWFKTALGGSETPPDQIESALMWSLNGAIWTNVQDTSMTIGVDWSSAESAANIVTAAQKAVLQARHVAEIATIQEKMAILDGHSAELRKEIDQIAEQLKRAREETIAEIGKAAKAASATTPISAAPARRVVVSAPSVPTVSAEEVALQKEALDGLKSELELKKRTLDDLKNQRRQSLSAAQGQLAELLTKYTPAHPEVRRLERTIELLSQPSPQQIALEQEVRTLTEKVKVEGRPAAKPETRPTRTVAGGPAAPPKPAADVLPADILKLLEPQPEIDTPVTVQLQGAVSKYAALRESIRQARVDLDTAQAAFAHRYKIVAPAVAPLKPSKPQPLQVLGIGVIAAIVLALAWPIVAELRTGMIVERWQVYQMRVPLLAELRLPPEHGD